MTMISGYVHDVNDVHDDDDDEFAGCMKKRARRFYLGALRAIRYSISSISWTLLLRGYLFGIARKL